MLSTWNKKKVLVELLSHCCTGRGRERSEVRYQPAIFNCYPRLGVQPELLLSLKVTLEWCTCNKTCSYFLLDPVYSQTCCSLGLFSWTRTKLVSSRRIIYLLGPREIELADQAVGTMMTFYIYLK